MERMQVVIANAPAALGQFDDRLKQLRSEMMQLDNRLNGHRSKQEAGEKFPPIIQDRLFAVSRGVDRSTYGPTATHRRMLEIANQEIGTLREDLVAAQEKVSALVNDLIDAGAPWIEGEALPDANQRK